MRRVESAAPVNRRFTTILNDIQNDGRGKNTPPILRPTRADSERQIGMEDEEDDIGNDLFTDSSSDEEDGNISSIFTPTSSSVSSSSSTLTLLTRIQSLEAQVRLHEEEKTTVDDDALQQEVNNSVGEAVNEAVHDALAAQAKEYGIEKQAMLSKMTKLTNTLLDYEDMLENATATEEQISSILDAKALQLVEHVDSSDEDGDNSRARKKMSSEDLKKHAATEIAEAVAQEHQRMMLQHSFQIKAMEDAHSFQLKSMEETTRTNVDEERQKRNQETVEVLERLKKSEQAAIESNNELQRVVEEVEQQVSEERERHIMVIEKRNTEEMAQRKEDMKKLANQQEIDLQHEITKHECMTITMEAEHKLELQHVQQQHEMHIAQKNEEWREQQEIELDALTSQHQLKIEQTKKLTELKIQKIMDEKKEQINVLSIKHMHTLESFQNKKEEERELQEEVFKRELEEEKERHRVKVKELEEECTKTLKLYNDANEQKKKSEQQMIKQQSEHELLLCSQVLENSKEMEAMQIMMQKSHTEESELMQNKHQQHVEEMQKEYHQLDEQRRAIQDRLETCKENQAVEIAAVKREASVLKTTAANELELVRAANQNALETCKDNHAVEIAAVKREASALHYQEMHEQRENYDNEILETSESLKEEHAVMLQREKAAYTIQRWCRETLHNSVTTATLRLLVRRVCVARDQLSVAVFEYEQVLEETTKNMDDMTLKISIIEKDNAIAIQNAYEDCTLEVDRRVLETTEMLREKYQEELRERDRMHEENHVQQEKKKDAFEQGELENQKKIHRAEMTTMKTKLENQEKIHRAEMTTMKKEKHEEITRVMDSTKAQRKEWLLAAKKEADVAAAAAAAAADAMAYAQAQAHQEQEQQILKMQQALVSEREQWKEAHEKELDQVKAAYEATTKMKTEEHEWNLQRITKVHSAVVQELEEEVSRTVNNGRIAQENALLQCQQEYSEEAKRQKEIASVKLKMMIDEHQKEIKKLKQAADNDRWARQNEKQALFQKLTLEHTEKIKSMMMNVSKIKSTAKVEMTHEYKNKERQYVKKLKKLKEEYEMNLNNVQEQHSIDLRCQRQDTEGLKVKHREMVQTLIGNNAKQLTRLEKQQKELETKKEKQLQKLSERNEQVALAFEKEKECHSIMVISKDKEISRIQSKLEAVSLQLTEKDQKLERMNLQLKRLQQEEERSSEIQRRTIEREIERVKEKHSVIVKSQQEEYAKRATTQKHDWEAEKKQMKDTFEEEMMEQRKEFINKERLSTVASREMERQIGRLEREKKELVAETKVIWEKVKKLSLVSDDTISCFDSSLTLFTVFHIVYFPLKYFRRSH